MLTLSSNTQVTEIDYKEFNVNQINSIKYLYDDWRQLSKMPTFALTYQGTWVTLVKNLGFSKEEAMSIEAKYHELYVESDDWVADHIYNATHTGYVVGAFGLKLRTPILAQTVLKSRQTPHEAEAEARTAGNALGQSYGLLNNRVMFKLMEEVYASEFAEDILPVALIHDANYFLVRDNIAAVKWLNDRLIAHMNWQDLPDLRHDEVGLGGELSIFYPHWGSELELKNNSTEDEIRHQAIKHYERIK